MRKKIKNTVELYGGVHKVYGVAGYIGSALRRFPKQKRSGGMEQIKPYTPANGEKNGAGEVEW